MTERRPTMRAGVRALPPAAWLLFAGTFVNRFGSFVAVFLALYLVEEGYSAAQAGIAIGGYGVGAIAASALGGHLADRLGRRETIAASMFGSAAVMLALSQARAIWLIVALTVLAGAAAELYRPASSALLTDLTPAGQRVPAFAIYRFAINLGFAAGPATAGLLAEHSFFLVFLGDAISSVVFGTLALTMFPRGRPEHHEEERRGELFRALRHDPRFVLFLVATFCGALVYMQHTTTLPLEVRDDGFSPAVFGALISLNGLVIIAIELPLTVLTQRLPMRPVLAVGQLLVGVGFALIVFADTVPLLAATVVVWTLGEIIFSPIASAYVADVAPIHLRGRYQGAWGMSFGVALVVGPVLGTLLYSASPDALWLACGLAGLLAAALVVAPVRRSSAPWLGRA
jgi:MFS family permease